MAEWTDTPCIFTSACSFYHKNKWIKGKLLLYETSLRFSTTVDSHYLFEAKLIHIENINKSTTNLFYGAVTFVVKGETFWFSSFASRTDFINKLEFIKRELLLDSSPVKSQNKASNELLDIAYNSQNALATSGKQLYEQGKQLNKAAQRLDTIHSDLNVADRIIDDLDSWLGVWYGKNDLQHSYRHNISIKNSEYHQAHIEYEVLTARRKEDVHQISKLVIVNKTLNFYDNKSTLLVDFNLSDISEIIAYSPWDMAIRKACIGKNDKEIHFVCKNLIHVTKSIQINCPTVQIVFKDSEGHDFDVDNHRSNAMSRQEMGMSVNETNVRRPLQPSTSGSSTLSASQTKALSMEESNELTKVLMSMKQMAVDISNEQDQQLRQLDTLNDVASSATHRIEKNRSTINKLL